jgi:hypothetical protein
LAAVLLHLIFIAPMIPPVNQYQTLTEAISTLKEKGYTLDLNLDSDVLYCKSTGKRWTADEFHVSEYHRFEGESDPGDMSIVYAISDSDGPRGLLVNGYGTYADTISEKLLRKLSMPEDMIQ